VPSFPGINQLVNYRIELASSLSTASGRYDCKEIAWFEEIMAPGKTFEDLADSGLHRFLSLDVKLGVQLIPTIRARNDVKILYDDILLRTRDAVGMGRILKGRQIVWLILDHYKCNSNLELVYTIEHLTGLKWLGDGSMHTFLANWHFIIGSMKDTLGVATLRDLFERKIRPSKELSEDLAHYDRCPEGHDDRTYKFLLESVARAIARQKMNRNRADRDRIVNRSGVDPGAFPGEGDNAKEAAKKKEAKDKAKAKEKAKAKGAPREKAKAKGKADAGGERRGRSTSRDNTNKGPSGSKVCVFFNHEGCKKGKDCDFEHRIVSGEEKKNLKRPDRSQSPGGKSRGGSPSPKGGGKKGAGKNGDAGKSGAGKGGAAPLRQWCSFFLKDSGCTNGSSCRFPHLTAEAVDAIKKANKAMLASQKE
jgi:hypothetical protein